MSTNEKLALMKQSEIRNNQNAAFLKVRRLSNSIRVVMERFGAGYAVSAQQFLPNCSYPRDVRPDGWRDTAWVAAATLEGARREFERLVASEERFLESTR